MKKNRSLPTLKEGMYNGADALANSQTALQNGKQRIIIGPSTFTPVKEIGKICPYKNVHMKVHGHIHNSPKGLAINW
jgi:hypothetical protein